MGWLTDWKYRKSITLSRASGAVSDYQMKLLVGESSGATDENVDCGGKCLTTFNDIRFTTSDGTTTLSYWIESITGTTPNQLATIWIKFNSIGTGATTFYMYYGNSGASAASSGTNTFIFFDDAETSDPATNGWTEYAPGQGSISYSTDDKMYGSKSIKMVRTGTFDQFAHAISGDHANIRMGFYLKLSDTSQNLSNYLSGGGTDAAVFAYGYPNNNADLAYYVQGTGYVDTTYNLSTSWTKYEYLAEAATDVIKWYQGTTLIAASAKRYATGYDVITSTIFAINAAETYYVDALYVANYEATEPAFGSWGSEESVAPLWNSGYTYRKSFSLTSSSGNVTNYQVPITVGYGTAADMTSAKFAGLGATVLEAPYDDDTWANPTNIYADDGSNASITVSTYDANDYSYVLKATLFGNAIPKGCVIKGIKVEIEKDYDAGGAVDQIVQLTKNNTTRVGDNKASASAWASSPTVSSYGSNTDLWGTTWTPEDINSPNFGVHFVAKATGADTDINVDYIKITVYYQYTVYTDSHCQTDFDDIRFTDYSGNTEIDYWLEAKTNSDYALFWVECPAIYVTTTQFYLYYGNADASSASNGFNTFPLFDDFSGDSIDTDIWTPINNNVTVSGGKVTITPSAFNTYAAIVSSYSQRDGRCRFKASVTSTYYTYILWGTNAATSRTDMIDGSTGGRYHYSWLSSANTATTLTSYVASGTEYTFETWRTTALTKLFIDGTLRVNNTTNNNNQSGVLDLVAYSNAVAKDTIVCDWIFIGNYVAAEPTFGTWSAETINPSKNITSSTYIKKSATEKNLTSDFRIKVSGVSKNLVSNYYIKATSTKNLLSILYIKKSATTQNLDSDSEIAQGFTTYDINIEVDSYLLKTTSKNIISNLFIKKPGYENSIVIDSIIKKLGTSKNIISDSYILKSSTTKNILSDLTLLKSGNDKSLVSNSIIKKLATSKSLVSDSFIKKLSTSKNLLSDSYLLQYSTKNILSNLVVTYTTVTKNITSTLYILKSSVTSSILSTLQIKKLGTTKNIVSISNIKAASTKNIASDSRTKISSEANIQSISRILTSSSKNLLSSLFIKKPGYELSISGSSYIKKLGATKSIVSSSYIKKTSVTLSLTSDSVIFKTTAKNISSIFYIKKLATTKNLTSTSYILKSGNVDSIESNSQLSKSSSSNFTSDSFILATVTKNLGSASYIKKSALEKNLTSLLVIAHNIYNKNIDSVATILVTTSKNINSDLYIKKLGYEGSLAGNCYIKKIANEKNLASDSYISESQRNNITSDSVISLTISKNILSTLAIKATSTKNVTSSSYITKLANTKNILSDSQLATGGISNNIQSSSFIKTSYTINLESESLLVNSFFNNILSNSIILKPGYEGSLLSDLSILKLGTTKNITSESYILVSSVEKNIESDSVVVTICSKNIISDSIILQTSGKSITSDSQLFSPSYKVIDSLVYIKKSGINKVIYGEMHISGGININILSDMQIGWQGQTQNITSESFIESTEANINSNSFILYSGKEVSITSDSMPKVANYGIVTSDSNILTTYNASNIHQTEFILTTTTKNLNSNSLLNTMEKVFIIFPRTGQYYDVNDSTLKVRFLVPHAGTRNADVQIQISNNAGYVNPLIDMVSFRDGAYFTYYDGANWQPWPAAGVPPEYQGNEGHVDIYGMITSDELPVNYLRMRTVVR